MPSTQPQQLTARFIAARANAPLDFLLKAAPIFRDWLLEIAIESLPPKETVMDWVSESLKEILESTEFPFADEWLDARLYTALLDVAGKIYDWIKNDRGVVV